MSVDTTRQLLEMHTCCVGKLRCDVIQPHVREIDVACKHLLLKAVLRTVYFSLVTNTAIDPGGKSELKKYNRGDQYACTW